MEYGFKQTEYLGESLNKYSAIGINVRSETKTLLIGDRSF